MKILVITNIPNPYRIPLFNELNIQLREKEWISRLSLQQKLIAEENL